jgi:hypothetical protein
MATLYLVCVLIKIEKYKIPWIKLCCCVCRENFRISMANYQSWFRNSIIFWLQTYRDECIQRMQRALQLERDVSYVSTCLHIISVFNQSHCIETWLLNMKHHLIGRLFK